MSTLKTDNGNAKIAMPVRSVDSAVRFSASSNCISFRTVESKTDAELEPSDLFMAQGTYHKPPDKTILSALQPWPKCRSV